MTWNCAHAADQAMLADQDTTYRTDSWVSIRQFRDAKIGTSPSAREMAEWEQVRSNVRGNAWTRMGADVIPPPIVMYASRMRHVCAQIVNEVQLDSRVQVITATINGEQHECWRFSGTDRKAGRSRAPGAGS